MGVATAWAPSHQSPAHLGPARHAPAGRGRGVRLAQVSGRLLVREPEHDTGELEKVRKGKER